MENKIKTQTSQIATLMNKGGGGGDGGGVMGGKSHGRFPINIIKKFK